MQVDTGIISQIMYLISLAGVQADAGEISDIRYLISLAGVQTNTGTIEAFFAGRTLITVENQGAVLVTVQGG